MTVRTMIPHDIVTSDISPMLFSQPLHPSFQPLHNLLRRQHLPEREPKPPQPRLMLFLIRTPARILHEPSLIAPIKRTSRRCIAAAIRHDATDHHPLHTTIDS